MGIGEEGSIKERRFSSENVVPVSDESTVEETIVEGKDFPVGLADQRIEVLQVTSVL